MDTGHLCKMIAELIPEHGVVGVPGLGTFLIEEMPAVFADRGYTICPPYRRLGYRYSSVENDVIVQYFAQESGQTPLEAEDEINAQSILIKKDLQGARSVELPGIGRLKLMRSGEILFIPQEDHLLFPANTGLDPISLKTKADRPEPSYDSYIRKFAPAPVEDEQESLEEPAQPAYPSEASTPSKPRKKHKALKAIAWIAGIAIVLAAALRIASTLAPDFIDSLLYTEEELQILGK